MDLPEDLTSVEGVEPERLRALLQALGDRAAVLRPDAVAIEAAVARCRPKSQPFGMSDFAIITTEPPAPPEDEPSSASVAAARQASAEIAAIDADDDEEEELLEDDDDEPVAQASADIVIAIDPDGTVEDDLAVAETMPAPAAGVDEAVAVADTQPESPRSIQQGNARLKKKKKKIKQIRAGTVIKGYEIDGLLGAGGMGQVYRARQLSLNREVAFKVLSPRFAANPSFRKRFLREARSAGRFHHRNLISVHDVDEFDGLLFFSMDLVDGKSVGDMIDEEGALGEDWSLNVMRQTLDALDYAHGRGVIHRDIKPDNIMIAEDGSVKLADLGLSRIEDPENDIDESNVTLTGTMMGTPYYMSPEQSEDAHAADARSDIYSLGATVYHMICGQVPFDGDSPVTVVVNATTMPLRFPKECMPSAPVRRLIAHMMAKDPEQRPASARDCLSELARAVARRQSPLRFVSHPAGVAALVAVVLVLVIVIGGQMVEASRERAFARFSSSVVDQIERSSFADAERAIDLQAARYPDHASRIASLRDDLYTAWDAWALQASADAFRAVEDDLMANRFRDAVTKLRDIEQEIDWCSPKVLALLKAKRDEARDLRHGAVWGGSDEEAGVPRNHVLADLDLRLGNAPRRIGDNSYRFTDFGRSKPLVIQSGIRQGEWTFKMLVEDRTSFMWGLTLDADVRSGNPWCYVGARGGLLEVHVNRSNPKSLGAIHANSVTSFSIAFTATELIIRHLDKEVRVPLTDDLPVALRWSKLEDGLQVDIVPPKVWFE